MTNRIMQLLNPALRALRTPQKIKADPNISTTPNLRLVSPQATHPTTRLSYSSGADGQARSRNLQSDGQAAGPLDQRDQLTVTFGTGEWLGEVSRESGESGTGTQRCLGTWGFLIQPSNYSKII